MKCAILISLYNAEKTLDKTFESLQVQTWQEKFEYSSKAAEFFRLISVIL